MLAILDFGSQYSELIARRIRETEVYSEVLSYRTTAEQLRQLNPKGIILSGGPTPSTTRAPHLRSRDLESRHSGFGRVLRHAADGAAARRSG